MTYSVLQAVQKAIQGTESIYWSSQPNAVKLFVKKLPVFFISFLWNAFVLFWIWGASGFERKITGLGWFGIPFLIVGIFLFLSPLLAYFGASRKAYAVTETRILEFSNLFKGKYKEHLIQSVKTITQKNVKNMKGDLIVEFLPLQEDPKDLMNRVLARMNPKKAAKLDLSKVEQRLTVLQPRPYVLNILAVDNVAQACQIIQEKINQLKNT